MLFPGFLWKQQNSLIILREDYQTQILHNYFNQ